MSATLVNHRVLFMKMNSLFFVLAFSCASLQVVGKDSQFDVDSLKALAKKYVTAARECATEEMTALKSFTQNLSKEGLIEMVRQDKDLVGRMHEQWGKN